MTPASRRPIFGPWPNPRLEEKARIRRVRRAAKAAREPLAPIEPALEQLLNPGIAAGTAGMGSGTGLNVRSDQPKARSGALPGGGIERKG